MILVDMSNLVISQMQYDFYSTKEQPTMGVLRNVVVSALLGLRKKMSKYGEMVLCFDGRGYWRRDVFKYYKGKRKSQRDHDKYDWTAFFELFEDLKVELAENFPGKCIEIAGCEADDVIATLAMTYSAHEPVCIISSDKDFIQVQQTVNPKIKQWSLLHKKFVTPENYHYNLIEHIVRGDEGDGVPNIFSDDDTFLDESKRQRPIRKVMIQEAVKFGLSQPEKFCKTFEVLERFHRNKTLIDLRCIPDEVQKKITDEFNSKPMSKGNLFNYCVQNRMARVMENL